MKTIAKLISVITVFLLLAGITEYSHADMSRSYMYHFTVEPVSELTGPGPASLKLTFSIERAPQACMVADKVQMSVSTIGDLEYYGEAEFEMPLDEHRSGTRIIDVSIPENDTSLISIDFVCANYSGPIRVSFVTTSDTVEIIDFDVRGYVKPARARSPQEWDSLTSVNDIYYEEPQGKT